VDEDKARSYSAITEPAKSSLLPRSPFLIVLSNFLLLRQNTNHESSKTIHFISSLRGHMKFNFRWPLRLSMCRSYRQRILFQWNRDTQLFEDFLVIEMGPLILYSTSSWYVRCVILLYDTCRKEQLVTHRRRNEWPNKRSFTVKVSVLSWLGNVSLVGRWRCA
jgi:hypothetical protein